MNFPSAHVAALSNDGMGTVFHLVVLVLQFAVGLMAIYAGGKLLVSLWSRS